MSDWFTGKTAYLCTHFGLIIGCRLARTFPCGVYWLSDRLASVAFRIFFGFRRRSVLNISIALGLESSRSTEIARRSLQNFFRASVEAASFLKASDGEFCARIHVEGIENLRAALAKQKGVLVLSAHLGNFFLAASRLAVEGLPTYVLVNQPRDGRFAQLMDDYRLQVRQLTIHARPRRQALQELSRVLRDNQIAVIIADEYRREHGIAVPLFGRVVNARRGPVTLALRTGAAIVPACLIRQPDNSLKLLIEPELELERSGKGKTEIRENTIRLTQWLERTVRQYPDQWNWMNIHWCNQENEPVQQTRQFKRAS
jgi:KDO2-lipid IV(A) lauroyltransferase